MGLSTFIGGVHPYEGKELSADKPIQVIQPRGELVFPVSQHIGAPAKPIVWKKAMLFWPARKLRKPEALFRLLLYAPFQER